MTRCASFRCRVSSIARRSCTAPCWLALCRACRRHACGSTQSSRVSGRWRPKWETRRLGAWRSRAREQRGAVVTDAMGRRRAGSDSTNVMRVAASGALRAVRNTWNTAAAGTAPKTSRMRSSSSCRAPGGQLHAARHFPTCWWSKLDARSCSHRSDRRSKRWPTSSKAGGLFVTR